MECLKDIKSFVTSKHVFYGIYVPPADIESDRRVVRRGTAEKLLRTVLDKNKDHAKALDLLRQIESYKENRRH